MADYQVIPDGPTAFGVKVTFPSGHGSTERGFPTEADAQAWIETQRARGKHQPYSAGRSISLLMAVGGRLL